MIELSELTVEAIDLVIPADNDIENIYITGGFSNNPLFLKLISDAYSMNNVFTSEIFNATALGAALVILNSLNQSKKPVLNLGLNKC
jgi:sugar (pentulose or hexulose) kinase